MLKWNGKGFIAGVPARDLTDDEVKEFGGEKKLIATGLYEPVKAKQEKKPKTESETWQA